MSIPFSNSAQRLSYEKELQMFPPEMGELQRHLINGEYDMFKFAPIYESNFVQVNKRGQFVNIHNHITIITVAVAATNPVHPLPNVMLLAVPEIMCKEPSTAENRLISLYPLKLLRMSVSDAVHHRIKLKLANGRIFYLQLNAPPDKEEELFRGWIKLIYKLMPERDIDSKSKNDLLEDEKKEESKEGAEVEVKQQYLRKEKESPVSSNKPSRRALWQKEPTSTTTTILPIARKSEEDRSEEKNSPEPKSEKQGRKNSGSGEVKRRPKGESPDKKKRPSSRGKVKQKKSLLLLVKKSFSNMVQDKDKKKSRRKERKTSEAKSD